MGGEALALHAVVAINEAVAARVHVRIINLGGVADEHDFRALADAGDDGFHLVGRELLGLVEDEEAPRDGAAADEGESLDFDETAFDQALVGLERGGAAGVAAVLVVGLGGNGLVEGCGEGGFGVAVMLFFADFFRGKLRVFLRLRRDEHLECVEVRLQPRLHFFLQRAGQETDVFAQRHDGTGDRDAVVARVVVVSLVQGASDGEKRLAGAGLAEAGDEGDRVVEQRVHEELLLKVATPHGNAAGGLDEVGNFEATHRALAIVAGGHGLAFRGAEQDVFVKRKIFCGLVLEGEFSLGAKTLKLVYRDGDLAVVALVVHFVHLVVEVVLGFEADGAGLERDVDILCDEDGRGLAGVAHIERGGDDPVVFFPEVRQNGAEGLH